MGTVVFCNGVPASADDLTRLAFDNYGSFTSMQVRDRAVVGLSLHLARLTSQAHELFGTAPSDAALLEELVAAVPAEGAFSVRVTLVSPDLSKTLAGGSLVPDVVVSVAEPREPAETPLRLCSVTYARETPHLKHRATFGLLRAQRLARMQGGDDALFVDSTGRISEGSTWNLCVHDGEGWVWPEAPSLLGVTQQVLSRAMEEAGLAFTTRVLAVPDLERCSAFATNAVSPMRPIAVIDETPLTMDPQAARQLADLWQAAPRESF